jgi:hypothetical protein
MTAEMNSMMVGKSDSGIGTHPLVESIEKGLCEVLHALES